MLKTIEMVIEPRVRDLGEFTVRRILPFAKKRSVGPFIFLDHMGPVTFSNEKGMNVRPHPHIGLSTVTFMFEGEAMHRDSLGSEQIIRPGDVNWMTAGRGIVHSERGVPGKTVSGTTLHGLQSWVALPKKFEEVEPAFSHHPAATIPAFAIEGVALKLIAGRGFDHVSPVQAFSDILYAEAKAPQGRKLFVSGQGRELGVYIIKGSVKIDGTEYKAGQLPVTRLGADLLIETLSESHFVIIGGEPLDGPREIWWNFVSSSPERMEQAKKDWSAGRFPQIPTDHEEFIPLPKS